MPFLGHHPETDKTSFEIVKMSDSGFPSSAPRLRPAPERPRRRVPFSKHLYDKSRISIGEEIYRWTKLKKSNGLSNSALAKLLLDLYFSTHASCSDDDANEEYGESSILPEAPYSASMQEEIEQADHEEDTAHNDNEEPDLSEEICVLCSKSLDGETNNVTFVSIQESIKAVAGNLKDSSQIDPDGHVCETCHQECIRVSEKQIALNEEISKIKNLLSANKENLEKIDDVNTGTQQREVVPISPRNTLDIDDWFSNSPLKVFEITGTKLKQGSKGSDAPFRYYKVKWEQTWMPSSSLVAWQHLIVQFWERHHINSGAQAMEKIEGCEEATVLAKSTNQNVISRCNPSSTSLDFALQNTTMPRDDNQKLSGNGTQRNTENTISTSPNIALAVSGTVGQRYTNEKSEEELRNALYTANFNSNRQQQAQQQEQHDQQQCTGVLSTSNNPSDPGTGGSSTFVVKQEPTDIIVVQPDPDNHGPSLNQCTTLNPSTSNRMNLQNQNERHNLAHGQINFVPGRNQYYQYIGNPRTLCTGQTVTGNLSLTKPTDCKVCGKTFSSESSLTKHAALCQRRRTYSCGYCPKEFFQKYTFRQHVLTHTREKSHQCGECGKKYTQKGDLNRHMYTHLPKKELPFKCDMCDRGFVRKDQLRKHFRLTHSLVGGVGVSTLTHPPTQAYMAIHPSTHTLP